MERELLKSYKLYIVCAKISKNKLLITTTKQNDVELMKVIAGHVFDVGVCSVQADTDEK